MSDRTVHAETATAAVVRYDRAGSWHIEDTGPLREYWGQRLALAEVVNWIKDQPEGAVTVHFGKPGGRQFDARVRKFLTAPRTSPATGPEKQRRGGDGDEARMGLVKAVAVEGQQVLGTCSPADTITYSALLSRLQRIHDARITSPEKDAVEACMNEVRALLGGAG